MTSHALIAVGAVLSVVCLWAFYLYREHQESREKLVFHLVGTWNILITYRHGLPPETQPLDEALMRLQYVLEHLGFSPADEKCDCPGCSAARGKKVS